MGRLSLLRLSLEHRLRSSRFRLPRSAQATADKSSRLRRDKPAGRLLRIHVERFNPALRLYERLGFTLAEDEGVYLFLTWSHGQPLVQNPPEKGRRGEQGE